MIQSDQTILSPCTWWLFLIHNKLLLKFLAQVWCPLEFGKCSFTVWFAEEAADLTLMWFVRLKIQILNEPFCCCSVWCRDPAAKSLRKGDKILVEKRFINCGRTSLLILSVFLAVLKGDEVNAWIWSVTFVPSDKILFLYLVMCYLHIKRKLQVFSPWWSVLQIKCGKQWVAPIP